MRRGSAGHAWCSPCRAAAGQAGCRGGGGRRRCRRRSRWRAAAAAPCGRCCCGFRRRGAGDRRCGGSHRGRANCARTVVQQFDQALAGIDHGGAGAGPGQHVHRHALADPGQRVGGDADAEAGEVARVGRAEDRDEQVGTFADAPARQGLAVILGMAGHAELVGGDIEDAAEAERGIDEEAAERIAGAAGRPAACRWPGSPGCAGCPARCGCRCGGAGTTSDRRPRPAAAPPGRCPGAPRTWLRLNGSIGSLVCGTRRPPRGRAGRVGWRSPPAAHAARARCSEHRAGGTGKVLVRRIGGGALLRPVTNHVAHVARRELVQRSPRMRRDLDGHIAPLRPCRNAPNCHRAAACER